MSESDKQCNNFTPDDFAWLQNELADTYWRWMNWKKLFMPDGSSDAREDDSCDLMNNVAPALFVTIREVLAKDVILRLCHLADPDKTRGRDETRENFSLANAVATMRSRLDTQRQTAADAALADFMKLMPSMKELRNRKLAHRDLADLHRQIHVPIKEIDMAVDAAIRVVRHLDLKDEVREFKYEDMIASGDADSLLCVLREGRRAIRLKRGQVPRSGDVPRSSEA
ncbi:MAG: hypothetical protein SFY96_12535 [Planctomycetota bacterium]|nr:hypothetical protein [Planctomycetota bacterium]